MSAAPDDPFGAFCEGPRVYARGAASGPLAGLRFAAKDNFDVAGHVTGAGNPDWRPTHGPARETARAVRQLLDAGAELVGKTNLDELAWGALGMNAHSGTPLNPACPARVPGGSSSGSASAVAGGLVDTALGTDTACSVRLPASACGLFGIRPTHGRVSLDGVVPLAPTLDTVGWFARDAEVLERVGRVLLAGAASPAPLETLLVAEDAFALAEPRVAEALRAAVERLSQRFARSRTTRLVDSGAAQGIEWLWFRSWAFQVRETWEIHGPWIEATRPDSRVLSRASFAAAADSTAAESAEVRATFRSLRAELRERVPPGAVLCIPTLSDLPPLRDAAPESAAMLRPTLSLMSIAGIAGLPQLTVPAGELDGCPIGLSLVGPASADERLLERMSGFSP
jgi:amidase